MVVVDNEEWIDQQFSRCDFGDQRRTKRMKKVASHFLTEPDGRLPSQNNDWKDLKAAYRLFDSDSVSFKAVASPHWEQTRRTKPGRYLLISDTTDINLTDHKATEGLGILGDGRSQGIQLHSCLAYDSGQGLIVGQMGALLQYRKQKPKNETRSQRLKRGRESEIWGALVDQVGSPPEGSHWIHVFDRGGDDFEAMCHIKQTGADWIIRAAKMNRNVLRGENEKVTLAEACQGTQLLGSYTLSVRARQGIAARVAQIKVSRTSITLPQPHLKTQWVKSCGISRIPLQVVVVQEVDALEGVTPIRWVLLTSLPVETFEDAWQIIEDYENRWLIEEYHKVLKSGCGVEYHALQTASRMEPLIALTAVVGIRLFQLKLIGRNQPEVKAKRHVPSSWITSLSILRPKLNTTNLTVYEFFRELAKLGGFLGRKGDGEPGWHTIWRGYTKMQAALDVLQRIGQL